MKSYRVSLNGNEFVTVRADRLLVHGSGTLLAIRDTSAEWALGGIAAAFAVGQWVKVIEEAR